MNKNSFKPLLILLFVFNILLYPQTSDPSLVKIGYMQNNNIGLSTYNDGAIAGFNLGVDIRGEWPIGSGHNYIGDMTPCIGVEVNTNQGTIHSVIISRGPRYGQGQEVDPNDNHFRGFNPITNGVNPNSQSYPISNDQSTWPSSWNSVWPGLYNSGQIIADKEGYFLMNDEWDNEFNQNFHPYNSNPSVNGLGISVAVRYLQFNSLGLEDVLFRVYDITNNSDYNYDKVFFGNITGSIMGGDGDSWDDLAYYDQYSQIIYYYDSDGIGNDSKPTATMGEAFIETPSFKDINSFEFFPNSSSPNLSDDALLWSKFTTPYTPSGNPPLPMDGDVLYSTKTFSLYSKQTKRIVSVIAFDYNKDDVKDKIQLAEAYWHNDFNLQSLINTLSVNAFTANEFNSIVPIRWSSNISSGSVDIYYSNNFGNNWVPIAQDLSNNGSYDWNASSSDFEESAFAQIKIILKKDNYIVGHALSQYFTLNKDGNGSPVLNILNESELYNGILIDDIFDLEMLIGDPEKENITCNIFYKTSPFGEYSFFRHQNFLSSTLPQHYEIELTKIPNSENLYLKLVLNDSANEYIFETKKINKNNNRTPLSNAYYEILSGNAESKLDFFIVDKDSLISDEYIVTFNDITKPDVTFLNVNKVSDGSSVLFYEDMLPNTETSAFNGIILKPDFVLTELDDSRSHWHSNILSNYTYVMKPFTANGLGGYRLPNDYKIVFSENILTNSTADTLYPPISSNIIPSVPVNFKVLNTTQNKEIKFAAIKSGTITSNLIIWFIEDNPNNTKRTWRVDISTLGSNNYPVGNDTLSLITKKGFTIADTLKIKNLVTSVDDIQPIPSNFTLYQNYPNPFNPSTTIEYTIPNNTVIASEAKQSVGVTLKVYDILGREIATLVNEQKSAGKYQVQFNASNLASGMYIYKLQAGSFTQVKKMMLLK